MFLNYAALLQKGAPEAHQAKSNSGRTSTLMKLLETLAARPLSLFLISVIVLSIGITSLCVGFAIHIAGPISIQAPHVEVPGLNLHTGNAPSQAEARPRNHGHPKSTGKTRHGQHQG
jgi:hypothetical protein